MPTQPRPTSPAPSPLVLPGWSRVLVVVAHPDDESFGLGGVVAAITAAGSDVHVLCLTHGEASTLGAIDPDPDLCIQSGLAAVRRSELALAADRLGVSGTTLLDLPDGRLAELADGEIRRRVATSVEAHRPDGMLVFDPVGGVTGHPDHAAASTAAIEVAAARGLPVLGWALPTAVAGTLNAEFGGAFAGHDDLPLTVRVDRHRQRRAIDAHASQAVPGSILWRRLELLGDLEHLRRVDGRVPIA